MFEEKLTFFMKMNEEIITVTCLLILVIYGLHDELDLLEETGLKTLDYTFLGVFIYGFVIEIVNVLYHQLVSLYGLGVRMKKWCSKNKVGQSSTAEQSLERPEIHVGALGESSINGSSPGNKFPHFNKKILDNPTERLVPTEIISPRNTHGQKEGLGLEDSAKRLIKKPQLGVNTAIASV